MFDNLIMQDDVQDERDILGGGGVLDTGLYDFTIEKIYGSVSAGGAKAINLELKSDKGQSLRQTIYVSNKQGGNTYEKNGIKNYLPGFLLATNLCLLTVKKELHQVVFEDRVLNLYDFDAKKELPTKVKAAVELIGQKITAGVIKEIVDKNKDTGTTDANGKKVYAATGETREQNEIDKFFRIGDGFTIAEIRAKEPTAVFKDEWAKKNTGVVRNKAKGAKAAGGVPGQVGGVDTAAKPGKSLFED